MKLKKPDCGNTKILKLLMIGISLLLTSHASAETELTCDSDLTAQELRGALLLADPTLFSNIPAQLRLDPAESNPADFECDLYRAASGMNGALCVLIEPASADDSANVVTPAGSYGDNAVDRFVTFPLSGPDATISCERAAEILVETLTTPFVPVETDPRAGEVCVRDVTQAPFEPVIINAIVRSEAGTEISTGFIENDGSGCFTLDDSYPPGRYEVLAMDVTTSTNDTVDLGRTSEFVRPEVMTPALERVWFVQLGGEGDDAGTLENPYTSYASFNAAQGSSNGPQPGDFIYALQSETFDELGPLVLLDDQWLVGTSEDLVGTLARYGLEPPPGSPFFNVQPAGGPTSLSAFEQPVLTLGRNNTLRGLDLDTAFAPGLVGDGLGSLSARNVSITASNGAVAEFANMALDVELNNVFAGGGFGSNGIDLRNTTGRFIVDGGEILILDAEPAPGLGNGVSLVNAENVTLRDLKITAATRYGIFGQSVKNFVLLDSLIENEFDSERMESGIHFTGLTGEVEISRVSVKDSRVFNIMLDNDVGRLHAELSELQLGGEDERVATNLRALSRSGSFTRVSVTGSIFRGAAFHGVDCIVQGSAVFDCELADLDIRKRRTPRLNTSSRYDAVLLRSLPDDPNFPSDFTLRYRITGSSPGTFEMQDVFSVRGAIGGDFTEGTGRIQGYVRNVLVGQEGESVANGFGGWGIDIETGENISHRLLAENLDVFGIFALGAVRVQAEGPTDSTLRNIGYYASSGDPAIWLQDRAATPAADVPGHCLDLSDSRLVAWDTGDHVFLGQRSTQDGRILLPGYQGSPNGERSDPPGTASIDIETYLAARGVDLFSFNPDIDPGVAANFVYGVRGDAETCLLPEFTGN